MVEFKSGRFKIPLVIHRLKGILRRSFFPLPMTSQVLLFRKIMHCKFLVYLLIVFLFFLFFSSACEFRVIERIGAQGKQNPDFIIIIIIIIIIKSKQGSKSKKGR